MNENKHKIITILKGIGTAFVIIMGTFSCLLAFSAKWMFKTWTNLTMDELVFHLTSPLEGTNSDLIKDYCNECVTPTVLILFVIVIFLIVMKKKNKKWGKIIGFGNIIAVAIIGMTIGISWKLLDVGNYLNGQNDYSSFIDNNYVDPKKVEITFPDKKKNLIYIFLESMEMTYSDKTNGGAFDQNVIPELTELSQQNEDFSGNSKKLNGGYSMPGTTWTMGAMFGQTSGLPLNISIDGNRMDTQKSFFPGITTLGDILKEQGYSQTLLIGSDATFGGRKLYFSEHGNYDIVDYNYARDNGLIPEDYKVWWGYEDEKLFGFAKEKLLELAQQDSPFNLTMLTVDTHFEDGYVCDICPDTFGDNQYANVIACSSKQVKEFVDWIEQQEFAVDTTIVISGDHPTMDSDFCDDIARSYERRVYTTYINASAEKKNNKSREYTTFDNFPTTIAALGATIDGDRLGLGTNLYSKEKTLTEEVGKNVEQRELKKNSKLLKKMSNINKKAYEKVADPTAVLKVGKYKKDYLPIKVENVKYAQNGIQSMMAAVWKEKDQSDLLWIPLSLQENGVWKAKLNMSSYETIEGKYKVHIYITDGNGELHNVASKVVPVKEK